MSEVHSIHIYYHHIDEPDAIQLRDTILESVQNKEVFGSVEVNLHRRQEYEASKYLPGKHYFFLFQDEDMPEYTTRDTLSFRPSCFGTLGIAGFIISDLHHQLHGVPAPQLAKK
jgi:hypothetical protein